MMTTVFRALGHRNYRLFFSGQGISLIGTWMQSVALSWLVYRMTHSAFLLGAVGFSGQIASFLLAPFAGVLSDRWNRHRMLVVTQTCALLQALTLAVLTLTGAIKVWEIIILALCLSVINAFDMPTRQAFVLDMLEKKEDLGNAIALNSFLVNGARFIGPSIAGLVIAVSNEGVCFLLNAVSFPFVIAALLAMRIAPRKPRPHATRILHELREGFAYAMGFTPIRSILLLVTLVSIFGVPYQTLMPIFAKDILHGNAHTMGFLMTAAGMGALTGAMFLASRKSIMGLGRIIAGASSLFGMGLIAFSLSQYFMLSLMMLYLTGLGMILQLASCNTILQSIADDDKRGRVMSFFAMSFVGMIPFGNLMAGGLAGIIGAPKTLTIGGLICIAGSLIFASRLPSIRVLIRPIYVKKGILPPAMGES